MSESIKPAEIALYDFLREKFDGAVEKNVLYQIALHDTIHQKLEKGSDYGVRIGEADSDFSVGEMDTIKEFDAYLMIVCFARVTGTDKSKRQEALQKVFEIHKAVIALLLESDSLGGRVCSLEILRGSRGYDSMNGEPYAVSNQPVVINPSGKYNFEKLGQ